MSLETFGLCQTQGDQKIEKYWPNWSKVAKNIFKPKRAQNIYQKLNLKGQNIYTKSLLKTSNTYKKTIFLNYLIS
jgi:hypothetical protein